ncbi:ABC-type multidrug transport system ATPase subunit [Rhodococcus sp. 27YEA15]|uniref:hypothetical protein n=1 Tax=Rhodococcus sp. 27YEA15 TaxID=3156259 RepID=UPI003C79CF30
MTDVDSHYGTTEHLTHPILAADGIAVRAPWGNIYGPIDFRVQTGGVTILAGADGRGRTALLLTLCGRMRPSTGILTSFGTSRDAHALFKASTVASIDEVDGIEQAITVRDVVTEHVRWNSPWYRLVAKVGDQELERVCRSTFGPHPIPALSAYVEELPELHNVLLRIAVANIRRPPLLVVGGVDRLTDNDNRELLLERLVDLGRNQTVVTADVNALGPRNGVREVIPIDQSNEDEIDQLDVEGRV